MRRQCRFLLEEYFSSRGRIVYSALETLRHLIGLRPTPQEWFQDFFLRMNPKTKIKTRKSSLFYLGQKINVENLKPNYSLKFHTQRAK